MLPVAGGGNDHDVEHRRVGHHLTEARILLPILRPTDATYSLIGEPRAVTPLTPRTPGRQRASRARIVNRTRIHRSSLDDSTCCRRRPPSWGRAYGGTRFQPAHFWLFSPCVELTRLKEMAYRLVPSLLICSNRRRGARSTRGQSSPRRILAPKGPGGIMTFAYPGFRGGGLEPRRCLHREDRRRGRRG